MNIEHNIKLFEELMGQVNRPGMDKLMDFIRSSDFYSAPASTRYHLSEPGGLLQHSLNVYCALSAKRYSPLWGPLLRDIPDESLILCALCHDFCKIDFYKKGYRSQKCYDLEAIAAAPKKDIKKDGLGEFVWQTVDSYEVNEKFNYGHGEKSAFILQNYITLKDYEALAIRWHMGYSEEKSAYNSLSKAIEKYPFILALHESDSEAANIMESGSNPVRNVEDNATPIPLHFIERLINLLTNPPIKGIECLVDDYLTILENPVERPFLQNDESWPFEE